MLALCSPRGLWCAGATATARFGAMTLALGTLAGGRWRTPTPIPKPGRRCRSSTGAGGASSAGSAITLAFGHHEDRTPTRGYEPTRGAAMAAFALSAGVILRLGGPLSGANRKIFAHDRL